MPGRIPTAASQPGGGSSSRPLHVCSWFSKVVSEEELDWMIGQLLWLWGARYFASFLESQLAQHLEHPGTACQVRQSVLANRRGMVNV